MCIRDRASVEGIVRLAIALLRSQKTPIHLEVTGVLHYGGADIDALRVVQNLLVNAVREAARAEGEVRVELADGVLRITNPVAHGVPARLWEEGVSGASSTGLGLTIARDAARKIGWQLRHELDGSRVSFVVTPAPTKEVRAPN